MKIERCKSMPKSYGFLLPVKLDEARVSKAVDPPKAISHAVDIANI